MCGSRIAVIAFGVLALNVSSHFSILRKRRSAVGLIEPRPSLTRRLSQASRVERKVVDSCISAACNLIRRGSVSSVRYPYGCALHIRGFGRCFLHLPDLRNDYVIPAHFEQAGHDNLSGTLTRTAQGRSRRESCQNVDFFRLADISELQNRPWSARALKRRRGFRRAPHGGFAVAVGHIIHPAHRARACNCRGI